MTPDEPNPFDAGTPFHPFADLFPLLAEDSDEFQQLVDNIRQHGQLEPITLYQGQILDGRNRYRAALTAGQEPRFTTHDFTEDWSIDKARSYVVSKNLHRRHLTREQRDEVIRRLREQGLTIQAIAMATSTSLGTVHRAIAPDPQLFHVGNVADRIVGRDGRARPSSYRRVVRDPEPEPEQQVLNVEITHDSEPEVLAVRVGRDREVVFPAPGRVVLPEPQGVVLRVEQTCNHCCAVHCPPR